MQRGSDLGYEATTGESYYENLICNFLTRKSPCEFEAASATSRVIQRGSDLGYEATTGESYYEMQ